MKDFFIYTPLRKQLIQSNMKISIENNFPTAEEYNHLRFQVDWNLLEHNIIKTAFNNSLFCVSARHEGELIGFARMLGDKSMFFSIHDVIVAKAWQGKGIGRCIMTEILKYLNSTVPDMSVIELISEKDKEGFYEQFGFLSRPNYFLGSGMTLLIKKNENI
jgi:predicted GNAT family N-acyltransferase